MRSLFLDYVGYIKGKYFLVNIDSLSKLMELNMCGKVYVRHTLGGIEK